MSFPTGSGVLLEEYLLAALRVDDQAALRRIIPDYVAWLRHRAAPGRPDNVILDGTSYRLFGEAQDGDVVDASGPVRAAGAGKWLTATMARGRRPARLDRAARLDGRNHCARRRFDAGRGASGRWAAPSSSTTVARLADELAHASARAILFEGTVSGIRRSLPYRVGHAVLNPARVIRRRLRRLVRKVRR